MRCTFREMCVGFSASALAALKYMSSGRCNIVCYSGNILSTCFVRSYPTSNKLMDYSLIVQNNAPVSRLGYNPSPLNLSGKYA